MGFQVQKQKATLSNLNLRKEAAGEDAGAVLAADLKLEAKELPAEYLLALAPSDSVAIVNIVSAFFTDAGVPRFHSLKGISFDVSFENCTAVVAGNRFDLAKIKNFTILKFHDGAKVDLEFTVQVHPSAPGVGALADKIKEEVTVTIDPQPELPLG